ncbi:macro domain-containing protein [bacterium]|nr:macro domain-containing protein [bacterium]
MQSCAQCDAISEPIVRTIHQTQLIIQLDNIVTLTTTVVVNAAQPRLTGGAGVDGAIHGHGGPVILEECLEIIGKIGRLETGKAVITSGGNLPANYVIHTVGPIWHGGNKYEPELLASAYRESLRLADQHQLTSIGFPSISTGAYGYPIIDAAQIALKTVIDYLTLENTGLEKVQFAIFSPGDLGAYRWALGKLEDNL